MDNNELLQQIAVMMEQQNESLVKLIDTKIQESETRIYSKIKESETRLDAKIKESETRLDAKIKESETRLDAKIKESETRLDTRIENDVTKRLDLLTEGYQLLSEKMSKVDKMADDIDEIKGSIAALEGLMLHNIRQ